MSNSDRVPELTPPVSLPAEVALPLLMFGELTVEGRVTGPLPQHGAQRPAPGPAAAEHGDVPDAVAGLAVGALPAVLSSAQFGTSMTSRDGLVSVKIRLQDWCASPSPQLT